jgi:hypothetical protein
MFQPSGRTLRRLPLFFTVGAALAALAVFAAACDDSSPPPPATTGDDAAPPAKDATAPLDSGKGNDASGGDANVAPDAGGGDATTSDAGGDAAADGGAGSDAADASMVGITWPPGSSFPTFPTAQSLDVIDLTSASAEEQYFYVTLEGIVNRTQPRIYTRDAAQDHEDVNGTPFWLGMTSIPTTAVADPATLVTKYASEIQGLVVYDPALIDTVNLATTIAAFDGCVVASPTLATKFSAAPYNLPIKTDLRQKGFTTANAVYQYELQTYQAMATNRMIVGLDPTKTDPLRDYAIATKSLVVWLDPTNATDVTLLDEFLAGLQPNAPYMGWWTSEPVGVGEASKYGVPTYAADWSRNLTVFGGIPAAVKAPAPPAPPALENKAYVAIFMSDGDNMQEDQHLIPLKWADGARGKVPISWTVQPGLVDTAPMMLAYYYATATANDVLVSGPSGLGYTYPQNWPVGIFGQYTTRTADYLTRAGLGVITVWNNGIILSDSTSQANDYASNIPHLLGVTDQLGGGGAPIVLGGSLPLLVFADGYAGNETDLETSISNQLTSWNQTSPLFVAVQGDMNQQTISPSTFLAVQAHFAQDTNVVFVRGDHLFQLIRQKQGLPTNP